MAINNLANTKWQFKNEPALSDLGTFAVNFTSNNTDYTSLTVTGERMKYGDDLAYGEPEPVYPVKGDLITMNIDGSDKQFRVLNANGSVAEVWGMANASDSQQFDASSQVYAGSALDTYLNETYYNTLTATAKAAIVDKTFTQDSWYIDDSGNPIYQAWKGTQSTLYQISLSSASFGNSITRHVYALSVQDVVDYLEATPQMTSENTTITMVNIMSAFSPSGFLIWLRTALAEQSNRACVMRGSGSSTAVGSITYNGVTQSLAVRPAFQIDLSQIDFSIST